MEIIGAAALCTVGIVLAAMLYGRVRGAGVTAAGVHVGVPTAGAKAAEVELPERTASLAKRGAGLASREAELARREAELEKERDAAVGARQGLERELERVSGISAARAKQLLLKELEDQSRHDAARLIRQIEEETKRDAERRVRNI